MRKLFDIDNVDNVDVIDFDRNMLYTFNMPNMCGFITNHKYIISIDKDQYYGYNINATIDTTENKYVDLFIRLSSSKSIDRYFLKV